MSSHRRPGWIDRLFSSQTRSKQVERSARLRVQPQVLSLEDRVSPAVYTFSNPANITIPDSGPGSPYPSTILATGVAGLTGDVDVTLSGFTHTWPDDVGVMLVDPTGVNVYLMDGPGVALDANGLNFTFDDEAAAQLPNAGALSSGSWRPMNQWNDFFDPPAPPPSGSIFLSDFDGLDANGTWSLYVEDFRRRGRRFDFRRVVDHHHDR